MEKLKVVERTKNALGNLNSRAAKRLGAAAMLALASIGVATNGGTAGADVPKMRVVEVCSTPGHNFVEVNAINDRDTPLKVTATAKNKLGVLITEDTLTIPAHGSDGQNFNTGAIEGGNVTYNEVGVSGNPTVDENVCGPKTTTTLAPTTTTTRLLETTTTLAPTTTTTRLITTTTIAPTTTTTFGSAPETTTTLAPTTTTTFGGAPETSVPLTLSDITHPSTPTIHEAPVAQPSSGHLLALTG